DGCKSAGEGCRGTVPRLSGGIRANSSSFPACSADPQAALYDFSGMKSIIVGTAGHIDHGKTALVNALTGIDADRLKEEKRRGISIELGFAHLDLTPELRLGFVDVPGHERFVRSMVAGVAGIDLVMFIVAAN